MRHTIHIPATTPSRWSHSCAASRATPSTKRCAMLSWAWPWMFIALPLPWLAARLFAPARTDASNALRVPIALRDVTAADGAAPVARWRTLLALAAWLLLVVAAARPQWLGE